MFQETIKDSALAEGLDRSRTADWGAGLRRPLRSSLAIDPPVVLTPNGMVHKPLALHLGLACASILPMRCRPRKR